jgi:hypothetical protein
MKRIKKYNNFITESKILGRKIEQKDFDFLFTKIQEYKKALDKYNAEVNIKGTDSYQTKEIEGYYDETPKDQEILKQKALIYSLYSDFTKHVRDGDKHYEDPIEKKIFNLFLKYTIAIENEDYLKCQELKNKIMSTKIYNREERALRFNRYVDKENKKWNLGRIKQWEEELQRDELKNNPNHEWTKYVENDLARIKKQMSCPHKDTETMFNSHYFDKMNNRHLGDVATLSKKFHPIPEDVDIKMAVVCKNCLKLVSEHYIPWNDAKKLPGFKYSYITGSKYL